MVRCEKGFLKPKEVFVLLILVIVIVILILPNYCPTGPGGNREAEVKSNLHGIQIALERYYTDHGEYPPYLLGGDIDGWQNWHNQWDGVNTNVTGEGRIASNDLVVDPLIDLDYLWSYPANPFIRNSRVNIIRTNLRGYDDLGAGDPRFGLQGNTMGMCLDDPNFFYGAEIQLQSGEIVIIETRRTLDHGDWMNVPDEFKNPEAMYYLAGGRRSNDDSNEIIYTRWPGNFFYRATGDPSLDWEDGSTPRFLNRGLWSSPQHYILGGYGAEGTPGMDVIRLEPFNPDDERIAWRMHESPEVEYFCGYWSPIDEGAVGGLPEVFGGGDEWTGPYFPYFNHETATQELIYGAPDGVADGIIRVLTNSFDDQF